MKKIFLIIIILLNANIVYSQEDTLNANWKLVDGGVTDYMQRGYIITQIYSFGANEHVITCAQKRRIQQCRSHDLYA